VARNAARLSILPACTPPAEGRSLTAEEATAFITEAVSSNEDGDPKYRLGVMFVVMVTLGVRPGEATGLLWENFDADAGTLAIRGSIERVPRDGGGYDLVPGHVKKSTAGVRILKLPEDLLPLFAVHRHRQTAEQRAAGPLWEDPRPDLPEHGWDTASILPAGRIMGNAGRSELARLLAAPSG
jgi:integrase